MIFTCMSTCESNRIWDLHSNSFFFQNKIAEKSTDFQRNFYIKVNSYKVNTFFVAPKHFLFTMQKEKIMIIISETSIFCRHKCDIEYQLPWYILNCHSITSYWLGKIITYCLAFDINTFKWNAWVLY